VRSFKQDRCQNNNGVFDQLSALLTKTNFFES